MFSGRQIGTLSREVLWDGLGLRFGRGGEEQEPRAEPTQCARVWRTWLASSPETGAGPKYCLRDLGRD